MSKANDIDQGNGGAQGFASAASNPQNFDFRDVPNLGMNGPNHTRYTPVDVNANLVSRKALPDNRYRNYLMIQNNSAGSVFIGFGIQVGANNEGGFTIGAGGFLELDTKPPFNSIYVKGSANGQAVLFIEGTIDMNQK